MVVSGCSKDPVEVKQEYYASKEDCERDWGVNSQDCVLNTNNDSRSSTGSSSGRYLGPRYYWDRDIGRPVVVDNAGQTRVAHNSYLNSGHSSFSMGSHSSTISRGGFGGFGRGFSGGG